MAVNEKDELIDRLTDAAERKGCLAERNRVMEILIKYKKAGWLDDSVALLLAQDIVIED